MSRGDWSPDAGTDSVHACHLVGGGLPLGLEPPDSQQRRPQGALGGFLSPAGSVLKPFIFLATFINLFFHILKIVFD